jgi:hypothetical protein
VFFPSEIRPILGNQVGYGAQKHESNLSAVSLSPCGPLALIPVNGEKTKSWGKFGPKNGCSARPWVRRVMIPANERCFLVDCTSHSASFLRDSAVYARK